MTGFSVHTGNNLNLLYDRFAEDISVPPEDPFTSEIIVVQSQGMRKWLSLKIADTTGIAAGNRFIFPNEMIMFLFSRVLKDVPEERFIDKERDVWRVMEAILRNIGTPPFAEISSYLGNPEDNVKLYQLSAKVIDLFDQYITYRPDMILRWDKKQAADEWQAVIWRELYPGTAGLHPPALKELFEKTVAEKPEAAEQLPARISLFGIPVLPRFHTDILKTASAFTAVNMYFLNPSEEYWFDTKSPAAIARAVKRYPGIDTSSLHYETGHPLLASMGRYAGDYLSHLMNTGVDLTEGFSFTNPEGDSLLAELQRDIYSMNIPPVPENRETLDETKLSQDNSISINSCHSPMREMEVLKDYLLERFEKNSGLLPSEVVVLSPDIEKYVPYINAVFGRGISSHEIPYSIVDRKPVDDTPGVRALEALLEISQTRVTASAVAALLEFAPIREAFGFSTQETAEITGWISASGIRWGLDKNDRRDEGLPEFGENSWQFGIDRLLLGYAMGGAAPFAGILPEPSAAESSPRLLGEFAGFINALSRWILFAREEHTLKEWSEGIRDMLHRFFPGGDNNAVLPDTLFKTIGYFEQASTAGLPLRVVSSHLKTSLSGIHSRGEFINGTMVFCSMLPMRSVPFRVVCLIGMNDRTFPRTLKAPDFDLMARDPQPGDRSLPDEDRFLFLETLISAGENFYISYIGRSSADNSEIPPSVVVSELTECIEACYVPAGEGSAVKKHLLKEHRLQPFSREYFKKNSSLYSYSEENLAASKSGTSEKTGFPFISQSPGENEIPERVNLAEILKFFKNPAEWYLENRLGISMKEKIFELSDDEPFTVDGLTGFHISQNFIRHFIRGDSTAAYRENILLSGELPPRTPGEFALNLSEARARMFYENYKEYLNDIEPRKIQTEVTVSGIALSGGLTLRGDKIIDFRNSKSKPADLLTAWIKHLFINAALKPETPVETIYLRSDNKQSCIISSASDTETNLTALVEIFKYAHDQIPVKFFPETSYAYFEEMNKTGSREKAMGNARAKWEPGRYNYNPESEDASNRIVFRDLPPFGRDFEELAFKVYKPLSDSRKDL